MCGDHHSAWAFANYVLRFANYVEALLWFGHATWPSDRSRSRLTRLKVPNARIDSLAISFVESSRACSDLNVHWHRWKYQIRDKVRRPRENTCRRTAHPLQLSRDSCLESDTSQRRITLRVISSKDTVMNITILLFTNIYWYTVSLLENYDSCMYIRI